MFSLHIGPSLEERAAAHAEWRDSVHEQRNQTARAIGSAVHSRNVSTQALASLQETVKVQKEDCSLQLIEAQFTRKLRGLN